MSEKINEQVPERCFFFCRSAKQALLEVVCLQIIFGLLYILSFYITPPLFGDNVFRLSLLNLFVPLCFFSFIWLASRWRLMPSFNRFLFWSLVVVMCISSIIFFEILISGFVLFLLRFYVVGVVIDQALFVMFIGFTVIGSFCFFALRCVIQLVAYWNHLRKTRLRWALTHAHLMITVVGSCAIIFLFIVANVLRDATSGNQGYDLTALSRWIVIFVVAAFLTLVAVAIVLPPSALFSHFFSRRLTRRIELLANATSALRAGNYGVRVSVEGYDEIARLQQDFNGMAADLERTMRELKAERDNVTTLLAARRELIASVSHELRTPVATVRSYLESTLSSWNQDQPPPTLKQDMQVMHQQTLRLQSLINDLFTLARAEVGRLEMRCQPTSVSAVIARVVDTLAPMIWRTGRVEVVAELDSSPLSSLIALVDEQRLEQILYNLVHNAIRHTPPGGFVIVCASIVDACVMIQVKDTGEGIAQDEIPFIWDRFYRARNASPQPGSGTGLGLAIVKELVEAMHGSVSVESMLAMGTCFTLFFPLVPASSLIESEVFLSLEHPVSFP